MKNLLIRLMSVSLVTALPVHDDDEERGDVPGWVMITLMSAVLVAALMALASDALTAMFNDAISRVR